MIWTFALLVGSASLIIKADIPRLRRDQRWFLAIFVIKVVLGLVVLSFKPCLGSLF